MRAPKKQFPISKSVIQSVLALLVGSFLLPTVVRAETLYSHVADCEIQCTLTTPPLALNGVGTAGLIIGTAGTDGKERCPIIPFQVPNLGDNPNPFLTASFSFNHDSRLNNPIGNVDLYGLGRRASATPLTNDFWAGTATVDPTDATRLQNDILLANSPFGQITNDAAGAAALAAYLNAQYAGGAGAGQFVFLRLSTDTAQSGVARWMMTSAEGATADLALWPQITYTAVPRGDPVDTIRVETRADGAGVVVPATNLPSGSSLTNFAIARNASGSLLSNAPAAWLLTNVTGSVSAANLVAAPDGRSAVFTGSGAGSAQVLAVGNATNLVTSGVITVLAPPDPFSRPFIWVRDSERSGILAKIATNAWAASVYSALISRVAADVASHQTNRDSFLRQLPVDWTLSPAEYKTIPTSSESAVRGPTESKFNDGLDCAVLFYLTGDSKYARCAADILHNAVKTLLPVAPSTSVDNGGWIFQDDFLKEARVTGSQLPMIYNFLCQYLQSHQVYDVQSAGMVNFNVTDAQVVFRTLYQIARDHGQKDSNWSALMSTCMLNSILALDNATERAAALQVYLLTGSSRQASLDYDYRSYDLPGDIWPESLQYSSGVGQIRSSHLVLLERYDPALRLFNTYSNLPTSLSRISYLRYPNGEQISFGDGHRYTDGQPFFDYELVYSHARSRGLTNLTALYGSLINGGITAGEYNRSTLQSYTSLGQHNEPLQLLWFVATIPEAPTPLVLPKTDTLPFAGIALQRNPSAAGSDFGLMTFVGGAAHVHSHASGMNMEIYGLGEVMGAKSGRTSYGATENENYYRVFASDNNIIVNGASRGEGGWGGFGINTVQVLAMEPQRLQPGVSPNLSFTCSSFVDDQGTRAEGTQQRTMAIIRTSPTTGYYVDIFRSKSTITSGVATTLNGNVTNQFHDYLYHNFGDTLEVVANGVPLPLVSQPNRFQTDIGDANKQPGWRYFTNTFVSYPHSQPTRAQFKATVSGKTLYMDMHLPGVTNREYAKVNAPAIVDAPSPYDNQPAPVLVVRQIGEAWNRPFAVVYEPHYTPATGGSVTNVTALEQNGLVVGLKVESRVGSRDLTQYVLSNINPTDTYSNHALGLVFKGRFAVVTDSGGGTNTLYLGDGSSLQYQGWKLASVGGANTQAQVEMAPGLAPVVTANSPLSVTAPSAPVFTQINRLPDGSISLTATGAVGVPYRLWASANLTLAPVIGTWVMVTNGAITTSPFTLTDADTTNRANQYYRFRTP